MSRPVQVKPDNFFLLLFNALRQRRIPLALRIASHSLLLVALALVIYAWVMGMQFKQAMQQQADALGQSLTAQTAASATERLIANDTLGLNVLLGELIDKNPLVAHAIIYSVDNRILAEAGTRPGNNLLGEAEGLYSVPITFQEVMAGQLRLSLNMQQFQQPMTISLQNMGLLSLILLVLTLFLSLRLGRNISTPLLQLRLWLRDPDDPAPAAGRQDEIGDLARQLQGRLVTARGPEPRLSAQPFDDHPHFDSQLDDEHDFGNMLDSEALDDADEPGLGRHALQDEPMPTPGPLAVSPTPLQAAASAHDDPFAELRNWQPDYPVAPASPAPAPAIPEPLAVEAAPFCNPAPVRSAVLAVQLGSQEQLRHLPRERLLDLLQRYRDCLQRAASLYRGQLVTLDDGSSLVLFSDSLSDEAYLRHALCCGELLRLLGHALQIDLADSGMTLLLHLGLAGGEAQLDAQSDALQQQPLVTQALALARHSRNLLLVQRDLAGDASLVNCARIRTIASPAGACCVERLLDPYPALLDSQLARLHDQL